MNDQLREFARQTLKNGLARCTEEQQVIFKLMYYRTPDVIARIKAADVGDVVDGIPDEKLDWAMQQVQVTLDKAAGGSRSVEE